jgi:hypothetical protein
MTTNAEVELQIARNMPEILRKLGVLREGFQCEVHLHRGNRKKRRDAEFEGNWDPEADSIRIEFSPMEEDEDAELGETAAPPESRSTEDRLTDLVRALDHAERRPGYEFVSLKWFRDSALPNEGFAWATDELARHNALQEAIDRRWLLTSKVPNPRPPNFPVTAIRLNRQLPEVNAALGKPGGGVMDFRPVSIRGESLSATVLRDRR